MKEKFQYRLTKKEKNEIAVNLIDILQKDANVEESTKTFLYNWVLTDFSEKRKAFFDVWEIVLKNYLPTTRPVLFRACKRISKNGKIVSFTGSIESARRFSNGKGLLIVCDTSETLKFNDEFSNPGKYRRAFYPLFQALKKVVKSAEDRSKTHPMSEYIGENEYIMEIDLEYIHAFKWFKNN